MFEPMILLNLIAQNPNKKKSKNEISPIKVPQLLHRNWEKSQQQRKMLKMMSVDSILLEAKQVLLIRKQAKKLVKYVKLVNTFE